MSGQPQAGYTTLFIGVQSFSTRSAILLTFSEPVTTFGFYLADVESRPFGTLAEMQLFDEDDNPLNVEAKELVPTGVVVGDDPGTYDVFDEVLDDDRRQWGKRPVPTTEQLWKFTKPTLDAQSGSHLASYCRLGLIPRIVKLTNNLLHLLFSVS